MSNIYELHRTQEVGNKNKNNFFFFYKLFTKKAKHSKKISNSIISCQFERTTCTLVQKNNNKINISISPNDTAHTHIKNRVIHES